MEPGGPEQAQRGIGRGPGLSPLEEGMCGLALGLGGREGNLGLILDLVG